MKHVLSARQLTRTPVTQAPTADDTHARGIVFTPAPAPRTAAPRKMFVARPKPTLRAWLKNIYADAYLMHEHKEAIARW